MSVLPTTSSRPSTALTIRPAGFGGFLVQANEFGTRQQVLHSYELMSRYVMPHFQGSTVSLHQSQAQAIAIKGELAELKDRAMERAAADYDAQQASRN